MTDRNLLDLVPRLLPIHRLPWQFESCYRSTIRLRQCHLLVDLMYQSQLSPDIPETPSLLTDQAGQVKLGSQTRDASSECSRQEITSGVENGE